MLTGILGQKLGQSQRFSEDGHRIPVTRISVKPCVVAAVKPEDETRWSVLLGFGEKKIKNVKKPILGFFKKAGIKKIPRFLREVKAVFGDGEKKPDVGERIKAADVFKIGERIEVIGTSKGKGFAGVVKRYHFKGGPKTHGQSNRLRSPGSIGSGTTPGRVYKGKRMAGRMGGERVTVKGLKVVEIDEKLDILTVKGLIPGSRKGFLIINKDLRGKKKRQ